MYRSFYGYIKNHSLLYYGAPNSKLTSIQFVLASLAANPVVTRLTISMGLDPKTKREQEGIIDREPRGMIQTNIKIRRGKSRAASKVSYLKQEPDG